MCRALSVSILGSNFSSCVFGCLVAGSLAAPVSGAAEPYIDQSDRLSGPELFREHCAVCHGIDGKGNGPLAQVLTVPPADLTGISERAGGVFPAARVTEIITFGGSIPVHGTPSMPVWGMIFSREGGLARRGAEYSRRAVVELNRYLQTIQRK